MRRLLELRLDRRAGRAEGGRVGDVAGDPYGLPSERLDLRRGGVLLLERGGWLREPANRLAQGVFVDNKYISPDTWYDAKGRAFPQAFGHLALVNTARVADELLDEAGEP